MARWAQTHLHILRLGSGLKISNDKHSTGLLAVRCGLQHVENRSHEARRLRGLVEEPMERLRGYSYFSDRQFIKSCEEAFARETG